MVERAGRKLRGGETQGGRPDWEPLLDLAPEEIDDFMWMFEVELEDGAMVQAYKHWWTRRYVHLDFAGRAFVSTGARRYEEVDPTDLLAAVLHGRGGRAEIVRQSDWIDAGKIDWAGSATRHRVSRAGSQYVIEHAGISFEADDWATEREPRHFFFGEDQSGSALEVAAARLPNGHLLVIHAMRMRKRFGIELSGGDGMAKVKKEKEWVTRSGEVITDEAAEKIADEIESDREVRWARRVPVGRPSLNGDGITPKVSFRIPTALYEELQVRANKDHRTMSDLAREALERFLVD